MSIIRGFAYVLHETGARTDDGYWFELAGTQAKVAEDFLTQTYIQSRKLEGVPTYKFEGANVYSTRAKPVKAHLSLSCHVHMLGGLVCSRSRKTFDKKIKLVVWPRAPSFGDLVWQKRPLNLARLMPQGTDTPGDEADAVLNHKERDNIRKAMAENEVIEGWFNPDLVEGRFRPEESFYKDTSGNDSDKETSRYEISGISALHRKSLEEELAKPMNDSSADVILEYEVLLDDKKNKSQGDKPDESTNLNIPDQFDTTMEDGEEGENMGGHA